MGRLPRPGSTNPSNYNHSGTGGGGSSNPRKLANGGSTILDRPTYIPELGAVAGEMGREEVRFTPISRMGGGGGGTYTFLLPAAPVMLYGEQVGEVMERRVTIRAAERAENGI